MVHFVTTETIEDFTLRMKVCNRLGRCQPN
jgi:hypothetical protein